MQTVTVQLMNEKALALLEQLEQLNVFGQGVYLRKPAKNY